MAMLTSSSPTDSPKLYSYRSQALLSPDGEHIAYSRIQLLVQPEFWCSRVSSLLFLEDLKTGTLQPITPTAPLARNPFFNRTTDLAGMISVVIPIAWSARGDRLLAREFESLFCSDIASDYAVIVDCPINQMYTVAPGQNQFTTAVLLGWSQRQPECALFQAGMLGEENWPLWTVSVNGETRLAENDRPMIYGQLVTSLWMGPQVQT